MLKLLISLCLVFLSLNAKEIYPSAKFKSMGLVNDFVVSNNKLYIANDAGTIDSYDLQTQKIIDQIILDLITTKMGRLTSPNVLSVDIRGDKLLIVSIGVSSFRNIWLYENFELTKIIGEEKKLTVKEARFIDDEKIMLGNFSSEIVLHDIGESYNLYKRHVTQSTLGDIALSEDNSKVVMSDESGEIRLLDVKSSKTLQVYSGQNVDNVYHVAYANGVILTAGQDRRVGVYQEGVKDYYIKSDFLVYCVGITPDGKTGLYADGEESNIQLFNTKTKEKLDTLVGHEGVINQIKFINDKELFSSERSRYVHYWRLNEEG